LQWRIEGAAAPLGFRVYRDKKLAATVEASAREFRDSELSPATLYSYSVAALYGTEEASSPVLSDVTRLPNEAQPEMGASFDIVVAGATPSGIAAAVTAARLGRRVALVSPSPWLGGLMTGGLSRTDFGSLKSWGGLFKEFVERSRAYYEATYGPNSPQLKASRDGYYFEPRVAKWIFHRMLAEQPNISVMLDHHPRDVEKRGNRVTQLYVLDRTRMVRKALSAELFIDATYEGDLAAQAGAPYRIGREDRREFNEEHAGEMFWEPVTRRVVFGSGRGDMKVQAYNYRLCLSRNPANRVPFPLPARYDRSRYATLLPDVRSGRVKNLEQVLSILPLPNEKWDANNHPLGNPSSDLIGGADLFPEADIWARDDIARAHREHIFGLIFFVQNDPELPQSFREEARRWGLAADEFVDNGRFPTQLYVREGRRIMGPAIFTENDARRVVPPGSPELRPNFHPDSIAVADYPIDSHATSWEKNGLLEGFFYLPGRQTQPSQVPWGVMTPYGLENVLVSLCVSSTHIGYGTLRMEPVFLALGTAAGMAAHLSLEEKQPPSHLPADLLQRSLLARKQVICVFYDVPLDHPSWEAIQFWGARGFFPEYEARPDAPVTQAQAALWLWRWMEQRQPHARLSWDEPAPEEARASLQSAGVIPQEHPWRPDEPLTTQEARAWMERARLAVQNLPTQLLTPESAVSDEGTAKTITRGEFCQKLYEMEASSAKAGQAQTIARR
jgi:hypothetical protein